MKIKRRSFLAGLGAAAAYAVIPQTGKAQVRSGEHSLATLIDLTRCDGCRDRSVPACVSACREANAGKFPEPDPDKIKDYWPQEKHEDWSDKRHLTDRLTPYNWTFVQTVTVDHDGIEQEISIPRRCMHCDNPPCVKLCPFGTNKKAEQGPVYIDPTLCFGGAKCRTVCPWNVPQRQAGVGIYTYLQPLPVGGGVMYKCDLCRERLAAGLEPACNAACPQRVLHIGPRGEIFARAEKLAAEKGGHIYGDVQNGGTSTLYLSKIPFEVLDQALAAQVGNPKKNMRLHQPENLLERHTTLAKAALVAPVAGVVGAFAATVAKREDSDEK